MIDGRKTMNSIIRKKMQQKIRKNYAWQNFLQFVDVQVREFKEKREVKVAN